MPTVLVVDDSPADRIMASRFLQEGTDFTIQLACDGNEALALIRKKAPDVVVTDLQMPECDGLELVDHLVKEFPRLPVILMTAKGSEAIAAEALRKGAASYVPKSVLAIQLLDTVVRVLTIAVKDSRQSRLMHSLADSFLRFEIQNDAEMIDALTEQIQSMLRCLPLRDESERLRITLAVKQALTIGLYHGNLELPNDVVDLQSPEITTLIQERLTTAPYTDRLLVVESRISRREASFVVRHEGPGFSQDCCRTEFVDPSSPQLFVRGFVLMQSIMDEVQILEDGHAVSLLKRPSTELEVDFEDDTPSRQS